MKKLSATFLALTMIISLSACNKKHSSEYTASDPTSSLAPNSTQATETYTYTKITDNTTKPTTQLNVATLEALTELIENDVSNTIALLYENFEKLTNKIDTYEKYKNNIEKIEGFYDNVLATQKQLNIRLREYSYKYAQVIISSDESYSDKYENLDDLYDIIYDDMGDEIYDEIYDGILDDMYDAFYDGVIDDGYDSVPYKEWHDVHSDEYGLWSDTRTDSYRDWSDMRSDVYGFWSDMRSEMWDDDIAGATKKIGKFAADIEKLKSKAN